jgi:ABC-2 type transport system permease protein
MLRLGVSDIAVWELAVSIAVLALSIIGIMFLATRAFRIYLLSYGKRPNWGEIFRAIRSG